ncbi:MAG: HEPN domain-containing protein [Campylobacterota bacterium]|nr:HEPN domain-containing protein [Campylobacterota bacterium]
MNEKAAKEWLQKSWHNLSGAKLFYENNHYTDVTAVELHYACEKILKSLLAYENKKIVKTHDLYDIYKEIKHNIDLENHLDTLDLISEYHIEESYPAFDREMPPRDEIKIVLEFSEQLFDKVCDILEVDKSEIIK